MSGKKITIQVKKSTKTHRETQPENRLSWDGKKEHKN